MNKEIALEIADFESFTFNGVCFSPNDLFNKFKRRAIENLLVACAEATGHDVLNKFEEESLTKFKKLPAQREIFAKLQSELDKRVQRSSERNEEHDRVGEG